MSEIKFSKKSSAFKKYIYAMTSLFALTGTMPTAFAQLRPTAFKNFSKHYKRKEYDLVLGAACFKSVVHNLRFFGNFEPGYDKDGKRDYMKDTSSDPLWSLTKRLFPSPTGQLATSRTIETNFGINATPKTIAILQNFSNSLRTGNPPSEDQVIQDLLNSFKADFTSQKNPEINSLKEKLNDFKESKKGLTLTGLGALFKSNAGKSIWKKLEKDFSSIVNDKTLSFEEKKKAIQERVDAYSEREEREAIAQKQAPYVEEIKDIVVNLKHAIAQEKDSIYPPKMAEQILSAFFFRHFNTQQDIRNYMQNLDPDIVDKSHLPQEDDEFQLEDIHKLSSKEDPYELDEIYDLVQGALFSSPIPYRPKVSPLNQGDSYLYNRKNNKILDQKKPFPDCVETAARHFTNLATYNPETKQFDLSFIEKQIEENNPYFANLKKFYETQPPEDVNNGHIDVRSLWNTVVGDLNVFDGLNIRYKHNNNELDAGFINFVNIFAKILNLNLPTDHSGTLQTKTEWVENSLKTILKTFNPHRDYDVTPLNSLTETREDISGTLKITAKDPKDNKELFSFDLYSEVGKHSDIPNITLPDSINTQDNYKLLFHKTNFPPEETEAIWLISENEDIKKRKIHSTLYEIFQNSLMDDPSKIDALHKILVHFDKIKVGKEHLIKIFENVSNGLSWDDPFIGPQFRGTLFSASNIPELKASVYKNLKRKILNEWAKNPDATFIPAGWEQDIFSFGLSDDPEMVNKTRERLTKIFDDSSENVAKFVEQSSSFILSLSYIPPLRALFEEKVNSLKLRNYDQFSVNESLLSFGQRIKKIDLTLDTPQESNVLKLFPNLETLELGAYYRADDLSFPELKKLEHLKVRTEHIKNLNLEGVESLKTLDVKDNRSIQSISFLNQLKNLETLDVSGATALDPVLELRSLPKLKTLNLGGTSLERVFLEDLGSLDSLNILGSRTSTLLIKDCPTLKRLQTTSIMPSGKGASLSSLTVDGLDGMETLLMGGADLSDLTVTNLKNLKALNLSKTSSNLVVSLGGNLDKLEKLTLMQSNHFPVIKGGQFLKEIAAPSASFRSFSLAGLENLKILNLMGSKVSEITDISGEMKNLTIHLKGSGITRTNYKTAIKDWEKLDESKLIF